MGTLYIVATPIGNLGDITYRAVEILKSVNFVACEDTRHSGILLSHYFVNKPLVSYHQHSKISKVDWIIGRLISGESCALVSDAGTPGVSDPGGVLAAAAIEAGVKVVPIPGPSALTTLVSVLGFNSDEFLFLGFLPKKKGRQTLLKALQKEKRPIIFYESPQRFEKTMIELLNYFGVDAQVVIGRELTKMHETIIRGDLKKIVASLPQIEKRGEFVICLHRM
ncbi:MAG: 16S rRNA (cytidine(1402)-2'-O)-methyltransferase [bacterium]|nr:16S rRNA (cytidine(1402)-2'-O)-methyltransferase [bacterium]